MAYALEAFQHEHTETRASTATGSRRVVVQLRRVLGNRAFARMLPPPTTGGVPSDLRSEAERRSGVPLGDVRVHHDSPLPNRLGALAYARGGDIHLAPGQQGQLPHELWHVVQQRRGQVPARGRVGGHAVNDDAALEADADRFAAGRSTLPAVAMGPRGASPVLQLRKATVADTGQTNHVAWGDATNNYEECNQELRPVLIEVMEYNLDSARSKIDRIADSRTLDVPDYRAILVAFNGKAREGDLTDMKLKKGIRLDRDYGGVVNGAEQIATHMESRGVLGGCYPFVWSATEGEAGYTFPFLEARARVTLHAASQALIDAVGGDPVIRSMDGDVSNDPLLSNTLTEGHHESLLGIYGGVVLTGGYSWDTSPKPATFWGLTRPSEELLGALNTKLARCIRSINNGEHYIRGWLNDNHGSRLIYWPEPNLYSSVENRRSGAESSLEKGQSIGNSTQQRESTYYIKDVKKLSGTHDKSLTTTKPLKDYFGELQRLILASQDAQIEKDVIASFVAGIRQTHLNPGNVLAKIRRWNGSTEVLSSAGEIEAHIDLAAKQLVNLLYAILKP